MSASFNKVILLGNLTRDPELRTLPSTGNSYARLGLAVNRRYTAKDGSLKEETTFVDIDAFGRSAETIAKYCTKGSGLLVEGRLKLDQWDDKNTGEKRSKLGVVLENFTFVGGRGNAGSVGEPQSQNYGYASTPAPRSNTIPAAPQQPAAPAAPELEEDIPF